MKTLLLLIACSLPAMAGAAQVPFTVHDYASGDGQADLVSFGVPFKPGELTQLSNVRILDGSSEVPIGIKSLATWPTDGSIRVALVQFQAPFTGATKSFTLDTGSARTTTDRTLVPVSWRFPRKIATLPANYLSASLVMWEQKPLGQTGYTAWEQRQQQQFSAINTEPVATNTCARTDQYYDSANSSYGIYVRTGGLQYLINGRRWAHHHGRRQIYLSGANVGHGICSGGYVNNTRYTFVDSLVRDYFFWGDEESLRVAGLVVDNFYMPHAESWYYKAPNTRGFWTEREAAFAQLGLVAYYEATGNSTYLDRARARFHSLHRMQVDNGNRAWVHNLHDHDDSEGCAETDYGSSSFMSGLLSESLIRYHKLTCDPVAAESLRFALDDLRQVNIATGAHAGQSLIYLGCPQTVSGYRDGNPDLDNLYAHAWAYAYRLSGFTRTSDRDFALALFNTSVSHGFVGAHKQFNQAFRDSGNLVGYLDPNVVGLRNCAASPTDGGTNGGSDGGGGGGNDGGGSGNDGGGGGNDGGDGGVTSDESGCGCGSASSFSAVALALMCLGLLGRNRRR
ncbi:MAG TPA: hypothetical protein VNA24_09720 [Hyalangium sp.]|nr:hypothetical protein [Hyalangium sp.]